LPIRFKDDLSPPGAVHDRKDGYDLIHLPMRQGKIMGVAEEIPAGREVQFQMDVGAVHTAVRNRSDANTHARRTAVTAAGLAAPGLAALDTVISRANEAPAPKQLADKLPAPDRTPQDGTGLLADQKAAR
jgi:hypothetical protein